MPSRRKRLGSPRVSGVTPETTRETRVLHEPFHMNSLKPVRRGQTQTMNARRLIAPGTVEEKIWELQQSKAQTIAEVLGEE